MGGKELAASIRVLFLYQQWDIQNRTSRFLPGRVYNIICDIVYHWLIPGVHMCT